MYMPNFHSIVRGNGENHLDLMGLFFGAGLNYDGYSIEELWPTYTDGSYFKSDGTTDTNASFSYAIEDVSKYDFVIIPNVAGANLATYSGLRDNQGSGAFSKKYISYKSGSSLVTTAYAIFPVGSTTWACITAASGLKLPVIGFVKDV